MKPFALPKLFPLLAAVALATAGCGEPEPPAPQILRPVRTVVVYESAEVTPEAYAGVARAGVESRLSFRVGGTLEGLSAKLGDRVRRGQILARLDPTDYRLKVEEARASLAQARAAVRRADADYDRARSLYENNNASKAELDAARASSESAAAQVDAGDMRLRQAEQQLGYTELRSPLAGAIAEVAVETNENVQAGQMVVLLASVGTPEVKVAVAENLVGRLQAGQPATITFDALPDRRFDAKVSEVAVSSRGGATFEAVLELAEDAGGSVRSGMAAEVAFFFDQAEKPSLKVPPLAVGEDRQGRFVYLFEDRGDGTGTVRRQSVEVGAVDPSGIVILSGLEDGSRVVTAGVRRLVDGMEVRALEEGADKEAAGAGA